MKGDFSSWRSERGQNFNGVLHQQGRVLLDSDWNAQTGITNDWQDTAGRDIIGAGVAAVPADAPDSFKIRGAAINGDHVDLTIAPGRVWADGLLTSLEGNADVVRSATYLQAPIETPPANLGAAGTRDVVVLEVWREEINGFQLPDLLIEPALGGPDTTERVHTETAFRLFRLTDPNDTCESIVDDLQDKWGSKGRLTVTLDAPLPPGNEECPLAEGGGYTGLEHNLYRIEIAQVKTALAPMFKWSQFAGGLVGNGKFNAAGLTLKLHGNEQAIINSGLQQFYLEALVFDPAPPATTGLGHWKVSYGARVTLGSNGLITLPDPAIVNNPDIIFGSIPAGTSNVFFRLWNGILPIAGFVAAPTPLQDGILLQFDGVAGANYVAGDYWTFPVRAGEIANNPPLLLQQRPAGIHYPRVPLGILEWNNPVAIKDCRRIFLPLTRLATCCSYRVGDGVSSHGDFLTISDALAHLPLSGGEICVLPGRYEENVTIEDKQNITIKGCGPRSQVVSLPGKPGNPADPVFHVISSQNIKIQSLQIEAHDAPKPEDAGPGILLEGGVRGVIPIQGLPSPVVDIALENLHVMAAKRSAIEVRLAYEVSIRHCRIEMKDEPTDWPGVFFRGEDSLIEENAIVVADDKDPFAPFGNSLDPALGTSAGAALGGLQLGGGSERIRVINNLIARGISDGIRLGSLITVEVKTGKPTKPRPSRIDDCQPGCKPGTTKIPVTNDDPDTRESSGGDLYEIHIERNRILNMGLNGIGVAGFFDISKIDEFISVHGLLIEGNEVRHCLGRPLEDIPQAMLDAMGYGGIALADVDELVIRDNFIVDNGPDFREPVCGIFVLHGEGIEILRNHILNNGAKDPKSAEKNSRTKKGRRGGINIRFALAPVVTIMILENPVPAQGGYPALKVHDNIVSVPVGQALFVTALGPVSVVGNQFTSRGMSFQEVETFVAATVAIMNLGLSNEFYQQLLAFAMLYNTNVKSAGSGRPGLDDVQLGKSLSNGNVLFANNQVSLDLMERGLSLAFSSILILSLDDIGFHSNQCDCNLFDDFVAAQAIVVGVSVRLSDNRFKEGIFNAFFSAFTVGLFNTTTDNQSTHCLFIVGPPQLTVDHSNISWQMLGSANENPCCAFLVHKTQCRSQTRDLGR
jgi:hypothetical protein